MGCGAHGFDQLARHPREGGEALGVHLDQRADDLEHVAAGREVAARSRDDDGFDVVVLGAGLEEIGQLAVALEGERVLPVRTVQGDRRHRAVDREQEVARLVARQRQGDGIGRSGH
jgi:hypothetical protein